MSNTMGTFGGHVIGSGLLARAFLLAPLETYRNACIYAAGVSNSSCTNVDEFERERRRLTQALLEGEQADPFIYFGTCSVVDPETKDTPYVQHKLAMEMLASAHPRHLICRLPQVAGNTSNPHTLLRFLYTRIARSEAFTVWRGARRNIIDVDDVVSIVQQLIADLSMRGVTLNVANACNYPITDIIHAMEGALGKLSVYNIVNRGSAYTIDISVIAPVLGRAAVDFGDDYLKTVMDKYYGRVE